MRAPTPKYAPIQSTLPFGSTALSAGTRRIAVPYTKKPSRPLDTLRQPDSDDRGKPHPQHEEQPFPVGQLNDDGRDQRSARGTDGCHCPEKCQSQISLFAGRKGDAEQSDNVWNHQSTTDAAQASHEAHGDQVGSESAAKSPEGPPHAAENEDVLMAEDGPQSAP